MMHCFRITKQDPALRDPDGAFRHDAWTAISDIGRKYNDIELTAAEYSRVEEAYVSTAVGFLEECGIETIRVDGLEWHGSGACEYAEGQELAIDRVPAILRGMLREELWCRLRAPQGYVHVGYDFYLYVGVSWLGPHARSRAEDLGLYVEARESPYLEVAKEDVNSN